MLTARRRQIIGIFILVIGLTIIVVYEIVSSINQINWQNTFVPAQLHNLQNFLGVNQIDYNFPVTSNRATTASKFYQYQLYTVPGDYNVYPITQSLHPQQLPPQKPTTVTIALPVLNYQQAVDQTVVVADLNATQLRTLTGTTASSIITLPGNTSPIAVLCTGGTCPDNNALYSSDLLILNAGDHPYYYKIWQARTGLSTAELPSQLNQNDGAQFYLLTAVGENSWNLLCAKLL